MQKYRGISKHIINYYCFIFLGGFIDTQSDFQLKRRQIKGFRGSSPRHPLRLDLAIILHLLTSSIDGIQRRFYLNNIFQIKFDLKFVFEHMPIGK